MMIFFLTFFSVSLAHWMDERQKVYDARQRRVDAICQKYNVATFSSNDTMEDLINQSVHNDSASGNLTTNNSLSIRAQFRMLKSIHICFIELYEIIRLLNIRNYYILYKILSDRLTNNFITFKI